ncbi:hypothetical protein L596_011640 [Steinernema carpocapsae]|uniref:Uncharacterized protein n=1 Tax=Steinernema carpocapsae TaxID=34508 RepID=A0A4U5NUJ7_STECR|nr:hypothetical protein L596_011640 [Steinernema carpocapsae]
MLAFQTSCFAYTVVLHSEKAIAVVFRGSKGPDQILQQAINLFLTKAMQPFHPTGGRVYDYYHQSFYRLWDSKIALDLTKYGNLLPEYDVWVGL